MNIENKQGLYTSPEVKVVEIKTRQVICNSPRVYQDELENFTDFEW